MTTENKHPRRTGSYVFLALVGLTALEFGLAFLELEWWSTFILIGVIKAWLVIRFYMHFPRLFAEEAIQNDS